MMVALALAGTDTGGRGTLPVSAQAVYDRGSALGLLLCSSGIRAGRRAGSLRALRHRGTRRSPSRSVTRYSAGPRPDENFLSQITYASLLPQETAPRKRGRFLLAGTLRHVALPRHGAHRYETRCAGRGSTGPAGTLRPRAHRDRRRRPSRRWPDHRRVKGRPGVLNPEQLLVMAASSCQMLWFLHLAAKARIDVVAYEDDAAALMPEDAEPVRITEIRCARGSSWPASRRGASAKARAHRPRTLLHREQPEQPR